MSQTTKFPKLTVRNKSGAEGNITSGSNVEVTLDDKKLPFLSFLKIELKPAKLAKVVMEMYVELDVAINPGEFITVKETDTGYVMDSKPVALKVLSNFQPLVAFDREGGED